MVIALLQRLIPPRHPLRLGWHYCKAFLAALRYGFPARRLVVIGITGTDGKTTTVSMLAHILRESGRSVGSVTTTHFVINDRAERNITQKTSISPFKLQRLLRMMVRAGCEYAVLEVSSHGLVQGRVRHIFPAVAGITNLTPEHLDYHGTMEQYRADKGLLFAMLKGRGTKVLNAADASFSYYQAFPSEETIVYGSADGDLFADHITSLPDGVSARLHTDLGGETELRLPLAGLFNVENAQCAIGCALALGIPLSSCLQSLSTFRGVEGRLEEIIDGQPFRIFLDFTVSLESYRKVLTTLRSMLPAGGRLLVLSGACGNRMREKRPEQGRICSEYADIVVLTSDETYGESLEKIIDELWSGIDQSSVEAHRISDRREAIRFILQQARPGDIIAFCGMAGVTTMMTPRGQVPWVEKEIVREELRKL